MGGSRNFSKDLSSATGLHASRSGTDQWIPGPEDPLCCLPLLTFFGAIERRSDLGRYGTHRSDKVQAQ